MATKRRQWVTRLNGNSGHASMELVEALQCNQWTRLNGSYGHASNEVKKKEKGKFLYSAVFSPQDRSKRFTLYFLGRPVHSDTISASLGSFQPYAAINAQRLLVHISTTVYSQVLIFIQLSELEQCRVKNLAQGVSTAARIRTRVLVVGSPKLYPWATALYERWTRFNGNGGRDSMEVVATHQCTRVTTHQWKWWTGLNVWGGHEWLRLSRYNWHTKYSVWTDWLPKRSPLTRKSSTSSCTRSVTHMMTTDIFVIAWRLITCMC